MKSVYTSSRPYGPRKGQLQDSREIVCEMTILLSALQALDGWEPPAQLVALLLLCTLPALVHVSVVLLHTLHSHDFGCASLPFKVNHKSSCLQKSAQHPAHG